MGSTHSLNARKRSGRVCNLTLLFIWIVHSRQGSKKQDQQKAFKTFNHSATSQLLQFVPQDLELRSQFQPFCFDLRRIAKDSLIAYSGALNKTLQQRQTGAPRANRVAKASESGANDIWGSNMHNKRLACGWHNPPRVWWFI